MRWTACLCALLAVSCGAASEDPDAFDRSSSSIESRPRGASSGGESTSRTERAPLERIVVRRSDVDRTIARGLGVFLGTVDLDPAMRGGQFVGFRVAGFHTPVPWSALGVDIEVGDVIQAVNGVVIVRPDHAQTALELCRTRSDIEVQLVRAGTRRVVRVPIEADTSGAVTASAPVVQPR